MSSVPIHIDSELLEENSLQEIIAQLRHANGHGVVLFKLPMCRNHSDVAEYYLEAAFIGQLLHSIDTDVSCTEESDGYYGSIYTFSFFVHSYEKMEEILETLKSLLSEEHLEPTEEIDDFCDTFGKQKIAFPDFVDSYYANMLGSNYDWLDDYRDEIYAQHPEWAYHCWLSARSPECGYPLYVSPKFWLLPAHGRIRKILKFVPDIESQTITTENIRETFTLENDIYLLGAGKTAMIPKWLHLQILEIASIVFPVEYNPGTMYWKRLPTIKHFLLSTNLDFIVCYGNTFTYILFRDEFSIANSKKLKTIRTQIEALFKKFSSQAGLLLQYKCNWKLLDDEKFELVCCALAQRDGRFPPQKVKKMGLAKSRDGGRDIIACTYSRPGSNPQRWLIQCKYSLAKKSLGGNAIQLGDLIDEYTPDGIIIATNLIINSSLHDKADKIAKSRNVEIELWDALEIERLLNINVDLYDYYFCQS